MVRAEVVRAEAVRSEAVWAEAVWAEAVRPAGARAGSEVHGMASALQHWRPDRIDGGICGGVSGLRRWWLALGKLWRFLVGLQCC
jgi:hypothetical protein